MRLIPILLLSWFMLGNALMGAAHGGTIPRENILRLVFMGKTGAGKSTTINAFFNLTKKTKWDNFPKLFPIKTRHQACNVPQYAERNAEDHSHGDLRAVTKVPTEYVATGDNLVVNLVDCPGVADPDGIDRDIQITKDISAFLTRAGEFNAICIVVPSTINRATAEETYLIEQLKTIIPKRSINRIFLVVTHTTRVPQNVTDFASFVGLPIDNVFPFDHFALSKEGHFDPIADKELGDEIRPKWNSAQRQFDRLVEKAKGLGKYATDEMARISEIKSITSEKIATGLRQVEIIETTETLLMEAQAAYRIAEEDHAVAVTLEQEANHALRLAQADKLAADAISAYENYTVPKSTDSDTMNTNCERCGTTCHLQCNLDNLGPNAYEHLSGCACIKDGFCIECPKNCSYTQHRHAFIEWKMVSMKRPKPSVLQMQSRAAAVVSNMESSHASKQSSAEQKSRERDRTRDIKSELDIYLQELKAQKDELQRQIVELYVELDAVSMGAICFHIGEYYNTLIAKTRDRAKRLKLQKDREFYVEQVELFKQRIGRS